MKPLKNALLNLAGSFTLLAMAFGCQAAPSFEKAEGESISHSSFTKLLQKHVAPSGEVDYEGFQEDSEGLQEYLDLLSDNPPADSWSKNEKLAYWINAYNAYTIKLIADNYPLESIQDLHPTIKIPGVSTVWHKKFFKIGGEDMSLNIIEHKILRKDFEEPRIHFAINCASKSCPKLQNKAFTADGMERQLEAATKEFVNDDFRNKLGHDRVQVSKIFKWFTGDFTENGSLLDFIRKYAAKEIGEDAEVDYLDYDWSLNE